MLGKINLCKSGYQRCSTHCPHCLPLPAVVHFSALPRFSKHHCLFQVFTEKLGSRQHPSCMFTTDSQAMGILFWSLLCSDLFDLTAEGKGGFLLKSIETSCPSYQTTEIQLLFGPFSYNLVFVCLFVWGFFPLKTSFPLKFDSRIYQNLWYKYTCTFPVAAINQAGNNSQVTSWM